MRESLMGQHTETIKDQYKRTEEQKNIERFSDREFKEELLRSILYEKIIQEFEEDMEDAGFEDSDIREFLTSLGQLSKEDSLACLAIPKELRLKKFRSIITKVRNGLSIKTVVNQLLTEAKEHGYTLGYHIAKEQIKPIKKQGSDIIWDINGYELDDRDGIPMAYYALDFANFYRKNPKAKYLYAIRAETGENSTHKQDTSNNWGRASSLSIVTELNLHEIQEKIQNELRNKKQAAAT